VLQLSGLLTGDVKESRNDNPTHPQPRKRQDANRVISNQPMERMLLLPSNVRAAQSVFGLHPPESRYESRSFLFENVERSIAPLMIDERDAAVVR
jgi:hypothetical protein